MKRIILDTNFLLAISQFKIDIFSELERICDFPYTVWILDKTVDELNKIIREQKGKNKKAAAFALQIIQDKVKVLKTEEGSVDNILINLADKENLVATQDRELKNKIKTGIIVIKQKKYLAFKNI